MVVLWQTKVIPLNTDSAGLLAAGKDITYHGCGDNFSAGIFDRVKPTTSIQLLGLCYVMVSLSIVYFAGTGFRAEGTKLNEKDESG